MIRAVVGTTSIIQPQTMKFDVGQIDPYVDTPSILKSMAIERVTR